MQLTAPLGGRAAQDMCSRPPRAHSRTGAAADAQRCTYTRSREETTVAGHGAATASLAHEAWSRIDVGGVAQLVARQPRVLALALRPGVRGRSSLQHLARAEAPLEARGSRAVEALCSSGMGTRV